MSTLLMLLGSDDKHWHNPPGREGTEMKSPGLYLPVPLKDSGIIEYQFVWDRWELPQIKAGEPTCVSHVDSQAVRVWLCRSHWWRNICHTCVWSGGRKSSISRAHMLGMCPSLSTAFKFSSYWVQGLRFSLVHDFFFFKSMQSLQNLADSLRVLRNATLSEDLSWVVKCLPRKLSLVS